MSERDLSGIWFTGERERNISGAFALTVSDWTAHAHRAEYWAASLTCSVRRTPASRLSLGRQHIACYVVWAALLSAVALRTLYFKHFKLFYFTNVIGLVQRIVRFVCVPNRKPRTERFNTNTRIVTPLIYIYCIYIYIIQIHTHTYTTIYWNIYRYIYI